VHCDKVFDTQIAHRLLNQDSVDPRDQNISLNHLLKEYTQVENDQKESVCSQMKVDPSFWWKVISLFLSFIPNLETFNCKHVKICLTRCNLFAESLQIYEEIVLVQFLLVS
jgi:hypothetical protein